MASSDDTTRVHPVMAAVATASEALASVANASLWSLTGEEATVALVAVTRLAAQQRELLTRLLVQAEAAESFPGLAAANGYAHATRVTRAEAHKLARLAAGLEAHPATRAAMAAGVVQADQALVICEAIEALPEEVDGLRGEAEAYLIEQAAHFDVKRLTVLRRRVLEVVDPEQAEAHEARLLAEQEKAAAASTRFTMSEDGHGRVHGRFTLPAVQGQMLRTMLMAYASPKHVRGTKGAGAYDFSKPSPQRMGEAFGELIERYPSDRLPSQHGVNATVVVTMTLETLLGGLASASLSTGGEITAGQARRLACEAGIIPAVLGTDSVPLDLGREQRLFSRQQRLATTLTHTHCEFAGCDVPAGVCHLHHARPWSRGGHTDLHNARVLCPRHHHLEHTNQILRT